MEKLTRVDVVNEVAETTGNSKKAVAEVIKAYETVIKTHVVEGDDIGLQGFLTFSSKDVDATERMNPKTNEMFLADATRKLIVRPSGTFKAMVKATVK